MPSDLLLRPSPSTVLREHQAVVGAEVGAVFRALVEAVDPGPESGFAIDEPAGLVVVQGGWWYRAEYRIAGDSAGSLIGLVLLNVASPAHWAGPLTGRAAIRSSARDFGDLVERVRAAV